LIWSWDFAASNGTCNHLTSKAGWVIDLGFAVVTLLTLYLLLGFTNRFLPWWRSWELLSRQKRIFEGSWSPSIAFMAYSMPETDH
jgi:hypothetical protein